MTPGALRLLLAAGTAGAFVAAGTAGARAQPAATPSPAASTAPTTTAASPTPRPGTIRLGIDAHTSFISDGTAGPGQLPPERFGFANGNPLSPEVPYDTLSSAPLVPGNAAESALYLRPTYYGRAFDLAATLGVGYVDGSVTNAAYWGEPIFPTLNPHAGSQALPYAIVFPTHPGQDDGDAFVASVLSGSIATKDGNLVLRGGWFDLTQSAQFVFVQPALTSVNPAIGVATPETLGDGPANLDAWTASPAALSLHGVDLVAKHDLATLELADASLPTLPTTPARMRTISLVVDHGEGTRYTLQYLQVGTGGDLVPTTILFGSDPTIETTPQGPLPSSEIGAQTQHVFGASATFHATRAFDGIVELGDSTYAADDVAEPGTGHAGSYLHAGLSRTIGRFSANLDVYRNSAYYADILLPYGVPENVWSVAWSWPGQWLKSNYQLIDDYPVNIDRQGYRIRANLKGPGSPLDVRVSYANFGQISPITYANALTTGFIDGFFLPQPDDAATLGRQHQYALFAGWHPAFGDLTLDLTEDTMRRPFLTGDAADNVGYDTNAAVLSFSRRVSTRLLATVGLARYGMRGSFGAATTNVDFWQRTGFAGVELVESPRFSALLSVRRGAFWGIPTVPEGPPPSFTGTLLVFEQRFHV
ncbi:MAG TPA: hypothetical protein VMD91_18280 [Candidatus Sulfotelmatobacter sp.]|nr:hypothetical protein [Candidatus Sulfotelmatobacter sp.]